MNQSSEPNAPGAVSTPSVDSESRDGGYSFVETVVAMVLMGVVVLAILTAVQTSVRASSISFEATKLETVLKNAADRVERAKANCDYDGYVQAAAIESGWADSAIASSTENLVDHNNNNADWSSTPSTCAISASDVQRVTISATSPQHNISRTIVVVRSDIG
jgi:Tfp pilus assembly protein PilV